MSYTTALTDHTTVTEASTATPSRTWAIAGVGAGLAGIVGMIASGTINAVYDERYSGQPDKIVGRLADLTANILVFHTATMLSVVLLVVFAAGLRRRLAAQAPAGSLLPDVAFGGLGLVSVAGLLGAGLTTEFIFGVQDPEGTRMVPETAVFFGHWIGTIPWLWVGAGIAGVAVAVASLRNAAAPRWIGWTSVVLGGLTLLLGISPLQYMAGMTGPLWVLIVALGFTLGDRSQR